MSLYIASTEARGIGPSSDYLILHIEGDELLGSVGAIDKPGAMGGGSVNCLTGCAWKICPVLQQPHYVGTDLRCDYQRAFLTNRCFVTI